MRRGIAASLVLSLCLTGTAAVRAGEPTAPPEDGVRATKAAIERGLTYLTQAQNRDGSWGSSAPTLFDIYAPLPGSQRSFQVASTGLALSALIEAAGSREEMREPIRRAADWLLQNHDVRRVAPNTLYNTWAHSYALAAMARLLGWEKDEARRARNEAQAQRAVQALHRMEFVEGGWGYYNFSFQGARPGEGSTSFTTATALVALEQAAAQGIRAPRPMIDRALALVRRCQYGEDAFAYSYGTVYWGTGGINKVKGSLARTPACLEALGGWKREVDPQRYVRALEQLEQYGHFLLIARKYPIPHETWYQNSGYFCFYGYYYAGLLLSRIPSAASRTRFASQLAARLVPLQEKDGSWYDYQLCNFHKAYGTGYVLLALESSRRVLEPAAADEKQAAAAVGR